MAVFLRKLNRCFKKRRITILLAIWYIFIIFYGNSVLLNIYEYLTGPFIIFTPGCKIPKKENPISKLDTAYVESLSCNKEGTKALISANNTHLLIVKEALADYKIIGRLICRYRPLIVDEKNSYITYSKYTYEFYESFEANTEFAQATCFSNDIRIYEDYFAFPANTKSFYKKESINRESFNVIVLGMDSTSRLNFYKRMPKTLRFLKTKLNAIEFFGYHRVDNTSIGNILPCVTGKTDFLLQIFSQPEYEDEYGPAHFIWDHFYNLNYATAVVEDIPTMGIFRAYGDTIGKNPITHHCNHFNAVLQTTGHTFHKNIPLCLGKKPTYKYFLNYMLDFVKFYKSSGVKFFGYFWSYASMHNFLNLVSVSDVDYENLFEALLQANVFDDTFLFFLSNQGLRDDDSDPSVVEESLPFLFVVLPFRFRQIYGNLVKNIEINSRRLITPFDIFETLNSINQLRYDIRKKHIAFRQDLFNIVPSFRDCAKVNIGKALCACL